MTRKNYTTKAARNQNTHVERSSTVTGAVQSAGIADLIAARDAASAAFQATGSAIFKALLSTVQGSLRQRGF